MEQFRELFEPIINTLQEITKPSKQKCRRETKMEAEAFGLLKVISASDFLVAFESVR